MQICIKMLNKIIKNKDFTEPQHQVSLIILKNINVYIELKWKLYDTWVQWIHGNSRWCELK
jgi:hypothetical protein